MTKTLKLTLTTLAALALTAPALAQSHYASTLNQPEKTPPEVSLTYTTLRTNASVGQCGCFWNQGAAAEIAVPFPGSYTALRYLSAVAEASGSHASSVPGSAAGLNLISGMGGVRVRPPMHQRFHPFAQVLFGGVHAFNSYFPATPTATTSANSFAMTAGGGVDIPLNQHLGLRAVQADYQFMQLPNNSTNQQHNIRLSAGLLYRFGTR